MSEPHSAPDEATDGGPAQQPVNTQAIAGFTLGIVSLAACWVPFAPILVVAAGLPLSRTGVRLGREGAPHLGLAVAGMTLCIVGAAAVAIGTGYWVWLLAG